MFLKCSNALSAKAKIAIVTKAVEDVQKKYYKEDEQFEAQMEAKSIIHTELEEKGALNIPQVIQKIFKEKEEFKEVFGTESLKLGSNTSWSMKHDARHKTFVLSRYKFVAKMLEGRYIYEQRDSIL